MSFIVNKQPMPSSNPFSTTFQINKEKAPVAVAGIADAYERMRRSSFPQHF